MSSSEAIESAWSVYIIATEQEKLYTGISTDVHRRFAEHCDVYMKRKNAKGAKFFRTQKPLQIVYQQGFANRSLASQEEARIKKLSAEEKRQLFAPN